MKFKKLDTVQVVLPDSEYDGCFGIVLEAWKDALGAEWCKIVFTHNTVWEVDMIKATNLKAYEYKEAPKEATHSYEPDDDTEDEPVDKEAQDVMHPTHYTNGKVQPIELMLSQFNADEFFGFLRGNIIKYIARLGQKDDDFADALKALQYCKWLVQYMEKGDINR